MAGCDPAAGHIQQFDAGASHDEKTLGGLIAVAAVMAHAEAEELLVARTPELDLAGAHIASRGDSRTAGRHQISGPHQAAHDQHVRRRIARLAAFAAPKPMAVFGRVGDPLSRRRLATAAAVDPLDLVAKGIQKTILCNMVVPP